VTDAFDHGDTLVRKIGDADAFDEIGGVHRSESRKPAGAGVQVGLSMGLRHVDHVDGYATIDRSDRGERAASRSE
jgi:hypothetical protein